MMRMLTTGKRVTALVIVTQNPCSEASGLFRENLPRKGDGQETHLGAEQREHRRQKREGGGQRGDNRQDGAQPEGLEEGHGHN